MLFILSVTAFYVFQLVTFALSFPKLLDMYRFYKYLLGIPDVSSARPIHGVELTFDAGRHTDPAMARDRAADW